MISWTLGNTRGFPKNIQTQTNRFGWGQLTVPDIKKLLQIAQTFIANRRETFSWSPIEKLDVDAFKKDPNNKSYSPIKKGVVYKLYLGYKEETIDMFASLC